jgi:hypothetical protein
MTKPQTERGTSACVYCGNIHAWLCPRVKVIEYHPDGTTKRVEFYAPSDYMPSLGSTLQPGKITYGGEPGDRNWQPPPSWQGWEKHT